MKAVIVAGALCVLPAVSVYAQQAIPFAGDREVTILTRNVYHGVDTELELTAENGTPIRVRRSA